VCTAGPVSICAPVCTRKRALNASVWGPAWWTCICHPRTEVVAVATTTTTTRRWTRGMHGQGVGSVLGNRRQGSSSSFSGGPSGGGMFVTHAPKSSLLPPPPPPLVGGWAVCGRGVGLVLGNRRQGSSSSFSGGPSGGGAFVTAPKSSPSLPPPPPLIGGRAVHVVKGLDQCWGTDGRGCLHLFQGAQVVEVHLSPMHRSCRRRHHHRC
jgi:hypothetical protein